ncbi:MAG: SMR family transporter [Pantoea sp.]|uniref:DMT family transporter n=1 Tax=Pantoea sp. TaxID=69393 RepID=UPI0023A4AF46|nr:SMR family transporter [Pantoea sp.]MDE1185467.1 SMR family transporter [Pantoea sp.]
MQQKSSYLFLGIAIVIEIFATNMLILSEGMSRPLPAITALIGFMASYFFLTKAIRFISLGIAYAMWTGIGIFLNTILTVTFWGVKLHFMSIIGIACIIIGVLVINLLSKSNNEGVTYG